MGFLNGEARHATNVIGSSGERRGLSQRRAQQGNDRPTVAHQVAVPADSCTGANWVRIQEFFKGMSVRPRGHFFYRDTIGFNVYCFGEREHAEQFCGRFNGEFIAPEERPRWPRKR